jgi:citrate lyase subunit beta/citryl-CoA lyase
MSARSLLFAPGVEERKLRGALRSQADAVVADLEDSVAPARKVAARDLVRQVLAETPDAHSPARFVRVNGPETPWWRDDLQAIADLDLAGVVLPKATAAAVSGLCPTGPPVLALIESARGVHDAFDVATHPRVVRLGFGAVDLTAELGLEPRADGLELLNARSVVVLASAAAALAPPADTAFINVQDIAGLEAEAQLARSLGFGGKLCIHPAQLQTVNRCFSPTADQLAWAEQAVAAYQAAQREGRGIATLGGQMIDKPVVLRARRLIQTQRSIR